MDNKIQEKIERIKIKAELFFKEKINTFIIDINKTWYSCKIIKINDSFCLINNFEGDDVGITQKLYYSDIIKLDEYKKKEEMNERS